MPNGKCAACYSYAINEHQHGRVRGKHSDLCDVCYWRAECDVLACQLEGIEAELYEAQALAVLTRERALKAAKAKVAEPVVDKRHEYRFKEDDR
jgi:hypothetical protein